MEKQLITGRRVALAALLVAAVAAFGQEPPQSKDSNEMNCPMHAEHMKNADASAEHGAAVDHRHSMAAVSVEKTHHSFRLFSDGGAIELHANASDDTATVDMIRKHMQSIASQFSANDFSLPMFIHDKTPNGVPEMQKLSGQIAYRYESLPDGARVRITTGNREALSAVHSFMRFQIIEHHTGDKGNVE